VASRGVERSGQRFLRLPSVAAIASHPLLDCNSRDAFVTVCNRSTGAAGALRLPSSLLRNGYGPVTAALLGGRRMEGVIDKEAS